MGFLAVSVAVEIVDTLAGCLGRPKTRGLQMGRFCRARRRNCRLDRGAAVIPVPVVGSYWEWCWAVLPCRFWWNIEDYSEPIQRRISPGALCGRVCGFSC